MGQLYKHAKPLPESVTLSQIIQSIPKEAFEKDTSRAVRSIIITLVFTALGLYFISVSPLWLLPVAWFYTGTALTGFFVLGHDCGHRSLIKSIKWNDIIGTIAYLPLLYPFHAWRISHNIHHQNTNKLDIDTAWQPVTEKIYVESSNIYKFLHRVTRGPGWFIGSVGHQLYEHFDLSLFKGDDKRKVEESIGYVTYFAAVFFPAMLYFVGPWGIVKYWFFPWLGFHFWMSTFTLVHHTAPHIPFLPEEKWRDAVASLQHTIHCKYPAWVDFLCHDISWHIPHHVTTGIPHYRLRLAYESIQKNWGPYIHECEFSAELMWNIISNCHIHDEETRLYKTFSVLLKSLGVINPQSNVSSSSVKQE